MSAVVKLNNSINQKRLELVNRKGVVFHYENARLHTRSVTRQKLLVLVWDILPQSPYLPELAPSDYHLFHSLQNSLNHKTFNFDNAINRHLVQFFSSKDRSFCERGIAERRQKFIEKNGPYIIISILSFIGINQI